MLPFLLDLSPKSEKQHAKLVVCNEMFLSAGLDPAGPRWFNGLLLDAYPELQNNTIRYSTGFLMIWSVWIGLCGDQSLSHTQFIEWKFVFHTFFNQQRVGCFCRHHPQQWSCWPITNWWLTRGRGMIIQIIYNWVKVSFSWKFLIYLLQRGHVPLHMLRYFVHANWWTTSNVM